MRSEAWRPAAAARNRSPREARDPALQALRPGCEELAVSDPAQMPVREARARSPKPPRWSAERRASHVIWDARRLARRLAYRVMIRPTGVPPSARTFLGAPPTPRFGGSEAKVANPGRGKRVAGTGRSGLFDIVRLELSKTVRRRAANSLAAISSLPGLTRQSIRFERIFSMDARVKPAHDDST